MTKGGASPLEGSESVLVMLGSNIDPEVNLTRALDALVGELAVVAASRVFETDPVADRPMPLFLNAALEIETSLPPATLKYEVLRRVEYDLGRQRSDDRNAPREIDMDVALYGDLIVSDSAAGIEIPDPDILEMAHIARPLADLAPGRRHPVDGRTLADIAALFSADRGVRLAAASRSLIDRLSQLQPGARVPTPER